LYQSAVFTDELGLTDKFFPQGETNSAIWFTDPTAQKPWLVCGTDRVADLHFVGAAAGAIGVARYRFTEGKRLDNITDWALEKFVKRYGKQANVTKDAIFLYVYAVLHDPHYRKTFAANLKREFPRVPLYPGFPQWVAWGKKLLDLHIGYQAAKPYPLSRTDAADSGARATGQPPTVILKSDSRAGIIVLDSESYLSGVPRNAWDYMLGGRSAIDWVLDQHKEKAPRDAIVREKFNTYRFAQNKERVIELLLRVVTVSVKTAEITAAMQKAER